MALIWFADFSATNDSYAAGFTNVQYQADGGAIVNNHAAVPGSNGPALGNSLYLSVAAADERLEATPPMGTWNDWNEGDEGYFRFDFWLDSNFQVNTTDYWNCINQVHDAGTSSPPIEFDVENGQLSVRGGYNGAFNTYHLGLQPVALNTAYSVIYRVKFSATAANCLLEVWVDGTKVLNNYVPPTPNLEGGASYWKGATLYRDPPIGAEAVYQTNHAVGSTYDDVAFLQNGNNAAYAGGTAPTVSAGADASLAFGQAFTRTATETGTGITARGWSIVSGPVGEGTSPGTAAALSWLPGSSPAGTTDIRQPTFQELSYELTSTAENSTTDWTTAYRYIEDIGDNRGYTAGIVGFTSATGDMLELVQRYSTAEPGNGLEPYLDGLQQCVNVGYGTGASAAAANNLGQPYITAWQDAADNDPIFRSTQLQMRKETYWDDARVQALADGVGPLGLAIHEDILVNHGVGTDSESYGGILSYVRANNTTPANGGSEVTYLNALIDRRNTILQGWGDDQATDGRVWFHRALVNGGRVQQLSGTPIPQNLQLTAPILWSCYGDDFRLNARPDPFQDLVRGDYVLQYSATNASGTGTDSVTVSVDMASAPPPSPGGLIGTLVDSFDTVGAGWTFNGSGVQGGQLYVNASSNAGAPIYSFARRSEGWTWSGSALSMYGVVMPAKSGDTVNAQLWMMDPNPTDTVDRLGYEYIGATNQLVLRGQTGAGYAAIGTDVTLTYDPVAHRNLRLTHTGTSVVWATSPDGLTWTTQRTLTTPPTWTTKTTLTPDFEAFRTTGVNDTMRLAAVNVAPPALPTTAPTGIDGLQARTLDEVRAWEAWLSTNTAHGWIGEYGWVTLWSHYGDTAQGQQWSQLGETYQSELDYAGLSGTVWASGREWGQGYPLGVHVGVNVGDALTIANTDAVAQVANHPTRGTGATTRWRGVNLSGWEQGINISGGGTVRSSAGYVHTAADFQFLAAHGVDTVRLPVAWERLQPTLSTALSAGALTTLDGMIASARQYGIRVVIDLHNYGRYTTGSSSALELGIVGWIDQTSADTCGTGNLGAPVMRAEFTIDQLATATSVADWCAAAGIRLQPLIGWDNGVPAPDLTPLADWATALGPGGTHWAGNDAYAITDIELGNENSFYYKSGLPGDANYQSLADTYGQRALAAAQAINAANPAVGVLVELEGADSNVSTWVDHVLAAGGQTLIDLMHGPTIHLYGPDWQTKLDLNRGFLANQGVTAAYFVTEFGIATDNGNALDDNYGWPVNLTYAQAATDLQSVVEGFAAQPAAIRQAVIYQMHDTADPGVSTSREDYFGVLQAGFTDKGALSTYARTAFATYRGGLADGTVAVLGDTTLTNAVFSDFWTRLSTWVRADVTRSGAVIGYGLMNEPHDLPGGAATWESASQAALTALRGGGDTRLVLVGGYNYSSLTEWTNSHPDGWITDSAANFRYEAHHYWDTASMFGSRSGTYQQDDGTGGAQIETYATELRAATGAIGLAVSSGLSGLRSKTRAQTSVPSTASTAFHGTSAKNFHGHAAVISSAAFGGFLLPVITDADYDLAEQRPDRYPAWLLEVDWTDQDYTGVAADLSDTVVSLTVERETTGELPAEAGLVDGYATGQITAQLTGLRPGATMPVAAELSPYRADSPLYGQTLVTPNARLELGLLTDAGPKLYRQLTGPVRELKISESAQSVRLTAVDPSERIRELITLPTYGEFASHVQRRPWAMTINSQWVVDHVLRANNIYVSPPPRDDAIVYCTGHGGLVAGIGFNGAPISTASYSAPQAGFWTEDQHPWGMLGTPEAAVTPNGSVGYQEFYGITDGDNPPVQFVGGNGVGVSGWLHMGSYMGGTSNTSWIIWQIRPTSNDYPRLYVNGFANGDIQCGISVDSSNSLSTPRIPTGASPRWRHVGVHYKFTSNTNLALQVRVDGTIQGFSGAIPAVNVPTTDFVGGYQPAIQLRGYLYRSWTNLQLWVNPNPPSVAEWQALENHVSEADLSRGNNELLYLPDVSSIDSWELLKDVVAAEFGVHGFGTDGRYFFRPRADARTTDATVDIDVDTNLSDVSYTLSSDSVRNVIGFTTTPHYLDTSGKGGGGQLVVISAQDPYQYVVPVGQVLTVDVDWPFGAVTGGSPNSVTPAAATRVGNGVLQYYWQDGADSSVGPGFVPDPNFMWTDDVVSGWTYSTQDANGNWTVKENVQSVVVRYSQITNRTLRITIENNHANAVKTARIATATSADVTTDGQGSLHIGGWPLTAFPDHVEEYRNEVSIARYRSARALSLQSSDWRQTPGTLSSVAQALLAAMAEPVTLLEDLPVRGNPRINVGDVARLKFRGDDSQPIFGSIVKINRTLDSSGLTDSISVRPLPLQTLAPEGWTFFIDVSDYQYSPNQIDLLRMSTLGYGGCIAKIGQGAGTTDGGTTYGATLATSWPTFRDQARELWPATSAGYWFVGSTELPADQASRCATALGTGPALSLYGGDASQLVTRVRTDGPYTVATEVSLTKTVQLTALRFLRSATSIVGTIRGRVYKVNTASSGTAIAGTDVTFSLSGTGWQTANLSSPVTLTPGAYRIAVNFPTTFAETDDYWVDGPGGDGLDKGLFTAPSRADSVGGAQGSWASGSTLQFPSHASGSGQNWWTDWVVNTTVNQMPVMLDWEDGGGTWTNLQNVLTAFNSAGINTTMLYTNSGYATNAAHGPATNIDALGLKLIRARYWTNEQDNPRTLFDDVNDGDPAGFGLATFAGGSPAAFQFTGNGVPYSGMVVDVDAFPGDQAELGDLFWNRTRMRRNLATNPSVETNLDGYSVVTTGGLNTGIGQGSSVVPPAGQYYMYSLPADSSSGTAYIRCPQVPVAVGGVYTFSAYRFVVGSLGTVYIGVDWLDSSGTQIAGSTSPTGANFASGTGWVRGSLTVTVPTGAAFARQFLVAGTVNANNYARWDAIMAEASGVLGSYFDGDTPGAQWEGTPGASSSLLP